MLLELNKIEYNILYQIEAEFMGMTTKSKCYIIRSAIQKSTLLPFWLDEKNKCLDLVDM